MFSATNDPTQNSRRVAPLALLVCLSIVLPFGVISWSANLALSGKPFGQPSVEGKIYQGSLKNGELWFATFRYLDNRGRFDCCIKRLDLTTGVERETGLSFSGVYCYPIWMNDKLYGVSQSVLYRVAETSIEKLVDLPTHSSNFHIVPFLYNGQVTTIVETDDGGFRLVHLIERHWFDGPKILLPAPKTGATSSLWVRVIQDEQQVHVFVTNTQDFAAYRNGFVIADEQNEVVSALAPENTIREDSGWETLQHNGPLYWMEAEKDGVFFYGSNSSGQVPRRSNNGEWQILNVPGGDWGHGNCVVLADPAEESSFVIVEDQKWSSAAIHRIVGNTIQSDPVTLNGAAPEYLARWKRVSFGIFSAWVLHLTVLLGGLAWLARGDAILIYEFGIQRVNIAPIGPRGLALFIDLLFVLAIPILTTFVQLPEWKSLTEIQLCNSLLVIESAIDGCIKSGTFIPTLGNVEPLVSLFRPLLDHDFIVEIAEVIILIGLRLWLECRLGVTPGKWICGTHTLRSTLRSAGFARTMVRSLLYWIDIPFFVTPLPAAISMMLSLNRQRLGDRVAETIVIRNGSIRVDENHARKAMK